MPGSEALFAAVEQKAKESRLRGYLLKQHGALIGAGSIMDAFYGIEEMEESCAVAWELHLKSGFNKQTDS